MDIIKKSEHRSNCPFSCVLDIIGDKWSILVIRNMIFFGHHEFKEFIGMPEKIATNILTSRLKKLLKYRIIAVIEHKQDKKRKLYYLTHSGKDLIGLMIEIMIWAEKYLSNVYIPTEEKIEMLKNPNAFKTKVISNLELWEKEHLN